MFKFKFKNKKSIVNCQLSNVCKAGFSFLELMIVIAIIGIMTVVALVYISKSSRSSKEVEFAAREVAASIREAQNNALGGKQPTPGTVACGHGFYFAAGAAEYKIFYNPKTGADCSTASKTRDAEPGDYITYHLSNDVRFGESGETIYFTSPHGIIYHNGAIYQATGPVTTPNITLIKGANTYNVCLYPSGNVEERKTGC